MTTSAEIPKFARIHQSFDRSTCDDIPSTIRSELDLLHLNLRGKTVALTAGSRGIANIATITKTVVDWVKDQGGAPFIVPAMGSHGGATAEGQAEVLATYKITASTMGCEIKAGMDVVELEQGPCPVPVCFDKLASEADAVIVINRVKPHTDFHGKYESGLMKMITIGLGNRRGAETMHNAVNKKQGVYGMLEYIPKIALQALQAGNIIAGLGIVENAYDETKVIQAMHARDIPDKEPALLDIARASMARLPADAIDVLVVDEMGKNISGTGMDTNIIGRVYQYGSPEPEKPHVHIIGVYGLTEETHGNACGMGLADVCPKSFFSEVDFSSTSVNIITSNNMERGKLPVVCDTDRHCFEVSARAAGTDLGSVRAVRIQNTLHVGECWVSPALLAEIRDSPHITVLEEGISLITAADALAPFASENKKRKLK